jgi:hypothetical protein
VDKDIIHIDSDVSLVDQFSENEIHHRLEGGGCVCETEEHDHGFEEASIGFKGRFPLIIVTNTNVVISPANVQLREEC